MKRALAEFAATLAALGAVSLYMELQDSTSRTRLLLDEAQERFEAWRVRAKVNSLIDSTRREQGQP